MGIFKNKIKINHKDTWTTLFKLKLDALMCKPTSSIQLVMFLFVDSRWHEPHDAVQCRTHGSTF